MKKCLIIILSLAIIFCFVGCSDNKNSNSKSSTSAVSADKTSNASDGDTVVVPNVVGMNKDEAIKKLEELGLKVEIEIEHLMHKDNNPLNDFEPDLAVVKQDIKQGVVVTKGTAIAITYNSMTDGFKYIIDEDQSITLTECYTWLPVSESVTIPKEYEGYLVKSVNSSVTDIIWTLKDNYKVNTIKIPKGVNIIGETRAHITYY